MTKDLTFYEQIFDPKFKKRILLNTPRSPERADADVATALATGKPLRTGT